MQFRSTTTYKVSKDTYMNEIFPYGLPVNAFINKGRCGIGGTSWETKNKKRSTLIIVPNIDIIKNKLASTKSDERPDYGVWGETTDKELAECAADLRVGLKVMCTPESIGRFLKAMKSRQKEIFDTWLLLLDESHTFISELYRDNILMPFKYYDSFNFKTIISATPFYFSDPKFYALDYHEITFTEELGSVLLLNAESVQGTLKVILDNAHGHQRSLHIFYNSVTAIRDIIRRSEITSCAIHCADSIKNRTTLEDLAQFLVDGPAGPFHKINFYTSKGFEGWDLPNQDAIMILVTDIYKSNTVIGVGSKGKQAIGRLRGTPSQIIHITNHRNAGKMFTLEHYRSTYHKTALHLIENNNKYIASQHDPKFNNTQGLEKFADIDDVTGLASLNLLKLDQQVNESAFNEIYRNIEFIAADWEKSFYNVRMVPSTHRMPTKTELKRQSQAEKFKEEYYIIKEYYSPETLSLITEESIKVRYPLAFNAYHKIEEAALIGYGFKPKKVEAALNELSDNHRLIKVKWEAKRIFKRDNFYFNSYITLRIQQLYDKFQILNKKRTSIAKAEPKHLKRFGIKIEPDKKRSKAGDYEHGYWVIEQKLDSKILD